MKARLPKGMGGGPGNMQSVLRQAQKMQDAIEQKRQELEQAQYTATAGGGMVEATISGKKEIVSLVLKPEVVDPQDIDMLQDLIIAAVNQGLHTAEDTMSREMEKITGGMNLPGVF